MHQNLHESTIQLQKKLEERILKGVVYRDLPQLIVLEFIFINLSKHVVSHAYCSRYMYSLCCCSWYYTCSYIQLPYFRSLLVHQDIIYIAYTGPKFKDSGDRY